MKKLFLISSLNFSWCNLIPFFLVLSPVAYFVLYVYSSTAEVIPKSAKNEEHSYQSAFEGCVYLETFQEIQIIATVNLAVGL